ncbi:hypothetical protein V6N13_124508 [Hibiscus sabdariffa]
MKISCLKERSWRGCPPEIRHRYFQFELDWFWSDVEDDGGEWRQRQRKLRFIGCQRLLNPCKNGYKSFSRTHKLLDPKSFLIESVKLVFHNRMDCQVVEKIENWVMVVEAKM